MSCDYFVRVFIDYRSFQVEFNADGEVSRIKQRKTLPPLYGVARVYNASYWVAKSHVLGNGDTMPRRIIAATHAKLKAEHEADIATP